MIYRVYTENKNREAIESAFASSFDAFTIFDAAGYWQGTREASLCIEVIGEAVDRVKIDRLATWIKYHNKQDAVLVLTLHGDSQLI